MEPPRTAVETLGGDAAEASREALDLAVAAGGRLDVHGPAHPLRRRAGRPGRSPAPAPASRCPRRYYHACRLSPRSPARGCRDLGIGRGLSNLAQVFGQLLGEVSKRNNVDVEALCKSVEHGTDSPALFHGHAIARQRAMRKRLAQNRVTVPRPLRYNCDETQRVLDIVLSSMACRCCI